MTEESIDEQARGRISGIIAAVILALALMVGGASRDAFLADGALQLVAALVLAWCVLDSRHVLSLPGRLLVMLGFGFAAMAALYLIPLPPEIWRMAPGREQVAAGFAVIDAPAVAMPLSLTPEETLRGLLKFLPPLALFVLVARLPVQAIATAVPWTLFGIAGLSVLLGVGQVVGGQDSPLYLHAFTNRGLPVGFMANANHQAILLLMTLPFIAALVARLSVRAELGDRDLGLGLIIGVGFCVVMLGVMIAGSLAGYGLILPALVLAAMTARHQQWGKAALISLLVVVVAMGGLAALVAGSPVLEGLGVTDWSAGTLSRPDTYVRTAAAIKDTFPVGSGLGSFESLFPAYEDPGLVTRNFMNHVHSDYLEVVLELGLGGALAIALFLAWYLAQSVSIWTREGSDSVRLRRAAASAVLIVLLHSLVDYPLRTPAIACLTAACLAIMAAPSAARRTLASGRRTSAADMAQIETPREGKHIVL